MLLDMHAHTSGVSLCCRWDAKDVVFAAKNARIDGIVLTNHFQGNYVKDGNFDAFAQRYVDEYLLAKRIGDEAGVKVFFGMEVTMEKLANAHLLVYGVDADFAIAHPTIYSYTQKQLYDAVNACGGALVWAHPFRGGLSDKVDLALLDGLEINCHPKYGSTFANQVSEIAKLHDLSLTCGGDFHADTYRPVCGMMTEAPVQNSKQVALLCKKRQTVKLLVQEPYSPASVVKIYEK